jgi:hypothetical protein
VGLRRVEPVVRDRSVRSDAVVTRLHDVLAEHCGGPSKTDDVTVPCVDRLQN